MDKFCKQRLHQRLYVIKNNFKSYVAKLQTEISLTLGTVAFIASVSTVVVAVTDEAHRDAVTVVAVVLICPATPYLYQE
jgi:hypothetical protein